MVKKFIEVNLDKRVCDVCGSQNLESLWEYKKNVCINGSHNGYIFKVNNVICECCGFCFVSPCFNEEILTDYYATSIRPPKDQPLDYDIGFRMDIINRWAPPPQGKGSKNKLNFIEIGPSTFGEFQEKVNDTFKYTAIEPSGLFGSEWRKIQDFTEANLAEIVSHYFVLEHVSNPTKFLIECNRLLKINGIMILEVPNIANYPSNPVALNLYEHQSHFSLKSLEYLANKAGFIKVECNDKSSRSFGMTMVFKKTNTIPNPKNPLLQQLPGEYNSNKQIFRLGLLKVNQFFEYFLQAKRFIESTGGEAVLLWGANQNLLDFLSYEFSNSDLPDNLVVIDSDSQKNNLLIDFDNRFTKKVFIPSECIETIKKSSKLVCFTRRHQHAILDSIYNLTGKRYKKEDILIIDINP